MLSSLRTLARAPPRPQCAFMSSSTFKALPRIEPERDGDLNDFARATEAFDLEADVVERKTSLQSSQGFSVDIKPNSRVRAGRSVVLPSFIKPTDLLPRDNSRPSRKRPLLGPSADVSRNLDAFHQLNIDPLLEATNPALLSHFVTEMGKVKGRPETNLTWRSQRRLTKAIRRAKMMGIIPILHRAALRR